MTIITTQSRVTYAGDNVSTLFPIPFEFFLNSDITAVKTAVGGAVTTLAQTVDYNLTGAGTSAGGTAIKTTPLLIGETMALFLSPPIEQQSHYPANNPFPAATLENDLDRQTQISQRLNDILSRSIRAPDGDPVASTAGFLLPSATQRANTFPVFDSQGNLGVGQTLPGGTLSLAAISALTGAQTPAEAAAGVTPVNLAYAPGHPLRYGAILDGVTDDTTALTNWAKVGGNLTWPIVATAKVTAAIPFVSNTKLEAVAGATIRQYTANTSVAQANAQTNISLRGLTFYAVGTLSSLFNGCGFIATGCTYVDVIDCVVTNHRGFGIMFNNSSHCEARFNRLINSPVVNTDLHNNVGGDIAIEGNSSYCKAIGNECISGNGIGIQCQTITVGDNNSYNVIADNLVSDCKLYGMMAYATNGYSDPMTGNSFTNNTVTRITGAVAHATNGFIYGNGFYAVEVDDLLVEGNNISNTHSGAVTFVDLLAPASIGITNCQRASILGNVCDTDKMYGISVRDPGAIAGPRQLTEVIGNNVSNIGPQGGVGIQIIGKANCKVDGNTVDLTAGNGIFFSNVALMLDNSCNNNVIKNVTGTGIFAAFCQNFPINGNSIDTTTSHGIYAQNCQDVACTGNTIKNHVTYGIAMDTVTNYTLEGNTVNGNGTSTAGYAPFSRWALSRSNQARNCTAVYQAGTYVPIVSVAPTVNAYLLGDIVWNVNPASAGFIGWVCTVAGTPGTWRTYGLIS